MFTFPILYKGDDPCQNSRCIQVIRLQIEIRMG